MSIVFIMAGMLWFMAGNPILGCLFVVIGIMTND
jgi:hypothetical protein